MILSGKLECMTDGQLKHYRDCFATMQCNPPNIECYFSIYVQCPGTEPLHALLQAAADEHEMDTVEVKQWTTTDRASLETKILAVDDSLIASLGC